MNITTVYCDQEQGIQVNNGGVPEAWGAGDGRWEM